MHPTPSEQKPENLPEKTLPFVWRFVRRGWWVFLLMLFLEAGAATLSMFLSYGVKELMEGVESAQGHGNIFQAIQPALWLFVGINVGMIICERISGVLLIYVGPKTRAYIRETLFAYLQHHSQKYFMNNFAGSLAARVAEVGGGTMQIIWTLLLDLWPVLITFIAGFFLLYSASADLAGVFAVWVAVYIAAALLLSSRARGLSKEFAAARSRVSGRVVDALTNMTNIKMFSRGLYERNNIRQALDEEVRHARRTYGYMEIMRLFQAVFTFALLIGMTVFALKELIAGQLSQGEFAMVFSLMLLIIGSIGNLSRVFLNFFEHIGTVSDGLGIIIRPHEVTDKPTAKRLKVTKGEIAFKDVEFQYDDVPLFKKLNIKIPAGQKVGLVGTSGAGKSTLVNLLLRLYDLEGGKITIDGQNIADITQNSLREQIAMIPQDPMLFHRSLMENIRYGKLDATDEEVIQAAKKAFCHEFIMETPQGYDTLVGERGVKLSGGQRQRIAIARAVLKNAPILLLDEATSSLDTHSEKYIQKSLNALMKNRTVIVIAHRLSTIAHLDRILVLENGEVAEDGRPQTLIKDKSSRYGKLWAMQAGGFLPDDDAT